MEYCIDMSGRSRARTTLRASEAREAYLVRLDDALRPLAAASDIQNVAARVLGEHLGATRAMYADVEGEPGAEIGTLRGQYHAPSGRAAAQPAPRQPFPERYSYGDYGGEVMALRRRGETMVVADVTTDARFSAAEQEAWLAGGVRAAVTVPLVKAGRFVGDFGVQSETAREWTTDEVALVEATAERTWAAVERARAEAALRESEERYRTLFHTMGQGYCDLQLVRDSEGKAVDQLYVELNPAYERLIGVPVTAARGRTASEVMPALEPEWTEAFDRIAKRGEPERIEYEVASLGRWFEVFVYPRDGDHLTVLYEDVTERKRQQRQQQFRLQLNDELRPLADAAGIQRVAMRLLGDHLGADRVAYADVDGEEIVLTESYVADGVPALVGRLPFAAFGNSVKALQQGHAVVLDDVNAGEHDAIERENLLVAGVHAVLAVPLIKNGRFVASLSVHQRKPHHWTDDEIALVQETAERSWAAIESARAEGALRESEQRLAAELSGARVLQRLSTRLIAEQPPDVLHGEILDAAIELMRADAASIQLLDEGGERLRLLATRSFHPESSAYWTWVDAGNASACGQALRKSCRVVVEDVEARAEMAGTGDLMAFRRSGMRAVQSTPLVSRAGRPIGMISTHWRAPRALAEVDFGLFDILARQAADLLERSQAESALRASEARFRALVENVREYAIFLVDPNGLITEWTVGAERLKGYGADEVLGRHLSMFRTPEDVALHEADRELAEAAATGRAEREGWRVRKGGGRFWAHEITTAVRDGEGVLTGFTKVCRDLTEQRKTAEVTERTRAQTARDALRRQLAQAEEEERRRLSRELHDELGQHLTALGLGLQALSDVAPPGSEVDRRAEQLRALVSTMGRELHALAVRVRPKTLDDFGLEAALATLVDEWSQQSGIAVDLHAPSTAERLPASIESAIYRIVQEALTNVTKHSGATRASVVVERRDGHVRAIVEDNGRGFDPAAASERPDSQALHIGLGMLGIRERAALLGGVAEIESSPGRGTTLYARIPIDGPASEFSHHDGRGSHG